VIHNGDVNTLKDAVKFHELTNCDGVMSAQGILSNPMLFSGQDVIQKECIERFLKVFFFVKSTYYSIR
jgi:tRNA-dihydrouridine synthase 4